MTGFEVQFSDDGNQVCIIPKPTISTSDFHALIKSLRKQGYKFMIPADERCGYIFVKRVKKEDTKDLLNDA